MRRRPGERRGRGSRWRGFVFDAPTASEWAAWWRTPRPARLYILLLVGLAVAVILGAGSPSPYGREGWVALATLAGAGIATVELGRLAEGGRVDRQRIHKGLSAWPFAAALVAGPAVAASVGAAVYAHAMARGIRITRWKWIGSWAIVTLAAVAAGRVVRLVAGGPLPDRGSMVALGGVGAALVAFLAVEAALLAVISRLNSEEDEVHLRAYLASAGFYVVEAAVLTSGAVAAALYRFSPAFLALAGPIYLLMQRGMLHDPLRHEARHDAKTGVLNYEAWRAAATLALGQARREGRSAAVLIVDLDHFKAVNDTHGHLAGDAVLTGAADAVVASLRATDLAGRFGGDELCALIVCDSLEEAAVAAERIRARIGALPLADAGRTVTASIGVVLARPDRPDLDLATLVAAADRALYQAKAAGRDRVCALVAA